MATAGNTRIGDFELLTKLGEGGMGVVYKARQTSLDRVVALKILPRRYASDKKHVERFLREARATAKLNHPNIVAGIDVGSNGGYHYFAMEFVDGPTLGKRIRDEDCLPEDEVLRIGAAVALGLAHAHAAGIVHRDVKPENILLDPDGTPKVADLGLSKSEGGASLTTTGIVVGTGHYIAPEQARGEEVDSRADTYSLGCTMYHAATGQPPFDGTSSAVVMVKHINERMPHPQSLNPALSDNFCLILSRLVAREPGDRYQSLKDAAEDMERLRAGHKPMCSSLPPQRRNFAAVPGEPVEKELQTADSSTIVVAPRQTPRATELPGRGNDRSSRKRVVAAEPRGNKWIWQAGIIAGGIFLVLGVWLALGESKEPKEQQDKTKGKEPVAQTSVEKPLFSASAEKSNGSVAGNPNVSLPPPPTAVVQAQKTPPPPAVTPAVPAPAPPAPAVVAEPAVTPAPAPDPNAKPLTESDFMKRFAWTLSVKASGVFSCGWTAPDSVETLRYTPDTGFVLLRVTRDNLCKDINTEIARLDLPAKPGTIQLKIDSNKFSLQAPDGKQATSDRLNENKTVRRDFFIAADPGTSIEIQNIKIEVPTK